MGMKQSNRGLMEWIVQRVSAILIGVYSIFLLVFFLQNNPMTYDSVSALFSHASMRIVTMIVVLAILWHAWIGLWTVFTDYVKNGVVRLVLELTVILLLLSYLVWCFDIFWG